MTDEKTLNPIESDTDFLARMIVTGLCEGYASEHKELVSHVSAMIGSRVRTAERLAKIEVLKEVVRIAENNGSYRFIDKVTDMLDELKECN